VNRESGATVWTLRLSRLQDSWTAYPLPESPDAMPSSAIDIFKFHIPHTSSSPTHNVSSLRVTCFTHMRSEPALVMSLLDRHGTRGAVQFFLPRASEFGVYNLGKFASSYPHYTADLHQRASGAKVLLRKTPARETMHMGW
jgi:hypothetical protein